MCERFRLKRSWKEVQDFYEIRDVGAAHDAGERHNIAPADRIAMLRVVEGKNQLSCWTGGPTAP